ncbi:MULTISPECIES: hypothetical protein [unclassified Paenibacillus]|uniref:hypothetical protein n=1 Tax=unclassified Paenibacillus TaxID=185978 RepID=UPI00363D4B0A
MNDAYKKLRLNIDYPVKIISNMDFEGNNLTIILQEISNKAKNQNAQSQSLRAVHTLIENYFSTKSNNSSYEKFMHLMPIFNDIAENVKIDLGYKYQGTNKELFKDLIDWSADWIEVDEEKDENDKI